MHTVNAIAYIAESDGRSAGVRVPQGRLPDSGLGGPAVPPAPESPLWDTLKGNIVVRGKRDRSLKRGRKRGTNLDSGLSQRAREQRTDGPTKATTLGRAEGERCLALLGTLALIVRKQGTLLAVARASVH